MSFRVPPFSVLDTKQKIWQDRKKEWESLGIKSEKGRGENLLKMNKELFGAHTSLFDPVLCEIMYNWFVPDRKCTILDPFAGGSVRGIVATLLGYDYIGIELRKEQVEANKENWKEINDGFDNHPVWIHGDAEEELEDIQNKSIDFLFSCPPYYNLEVYSKEKGELSNIKSYERFLDKYSRIISIAGNKLKNRRFASFIVSNIRDDEGFIYNLFGDTISKFEANNMRLYNDIVLVNAASSLPARVNTFFPNYRKVGKMHQNIPVFFKGNPKRIPDYYGEIKADEQLGPEDF